MCSNNCIVFLLFPQLILFLCNKRMDLFCYLYIIPDTFRTYYSLLHTRKMDKTCHFNKTHSNIQFTPCYYKQKYFILGCISIEERLLAYNTFGFARGFKPRVQALRVEFVGASFADQSRHLTVLRMQD